MHVCLIYTWILKWFILCVGCTLYLQFYILTVLHMLMYSVVLYWCVKFYAQTVVCWCVLFYAKSVVCWCVLFYTQTVLCWCVQFYAKSVECWCVQFYTPTVVNMMVCPVLCSKCLYVGVYPILCSNCCMLMCLQFMLQL